MGVNHYEKRGFIDLKWPENDVDELAAELRRIALDLVVVMKGSLADNDPLKATSENVPKRLEAMLKGVGKEDIVWVSLSGHGQQITLVAMTTSRRWIPISSARPTRLTATARRWWRLTI